MFLVTGATGQVGRRVVRLLRERDVPVRAFVRLASRYTELEHRGAEIFVGDLKRDKDIQKACQGVRAVISTHGSNESNAEEDAQTIDYQANVELIDQAKDAGAEHFTFISVLGVERGYEDAPVFKAKWEVERYLQASGLNHTILRPSGFASNLLAPAERFRQTGIYLLVGDPINRTSIVSTDDLARIAAESAEREGARNQVFCVGGPEVLRREDIPKTFGRIFDREPTILNLPLLAVIILEWYRQVIINVSVLWALILCLALALVVKSLLPLPAVLVGLDEIQLITIVVGVFWKGRPYWR